MYRSSLLCKLLLFTCMIGAEFWCTKQNFTFVSEIAASQRLSVVIICHLQKEKNMISFVSLILLINFIDSILFTHINRCLWNENSFIEGKFD